MSLEFTNAVFAAMKMAGPPSAAPGAASPGPDRNTGGENTPKQWTPPLAKAVPSDTTPRKGGEPQNPGQHTLVTSHLRIEALLVLCLYLAGTFLAIRGTFHLVLSVVGLGAELEKILAGFFIPILWLLSLIPVFPRFIKSVPEYTALVTNDLLSGVLRIYGPGTYLVYPWEEVKPQNIVSLERITIAIRGSFPASGGGTMELTGSIRYYPKLEGAACHIGIDKSTIERGFIDLFLHDLGEITARLTIDEILQNITLIQHSVIEDFENGVGRKGALETAFGVHFEGLNFVLKPDAATEQARRLEFEYGKRVASMKRLETVDPAAAEAFLLDQGKISKQIMDIRGLEAIGTAAGTIAALLASSSSSLAERIAKQIAVGKAGRKDHE